MESISLAWWTWLLFGLLLMVVELLLPTGFFLFFFGLGGVVTALLAFSGIASSFIAQGLWFVGVSLLGVFVLRKPLLAKFHWRNRVHTVDSLIGQVARTLEVIPPQSVGRVDMRGTSWSALNTGSEALGVDSQCRIEKVEGLTLHVKS